MFSSACLRFKHGLGGRIRSAAMAQNRPEFESLSDRALLESHEPNNFNTFVSSPLLGIEVVQLISQKWIFVNGPH